MDQDLFHNLSCNLCDDKTLSVELSNDYYKAISSYFDLPPLLEAYKKILDREEDVEDLIEKELLQVPDFRKTIKEIIKVWFLGKGDSLNTLKGDKHYFHYEALIWKVIHAHPPGITGGYYGYWHYKPEN